MIHWISKHGGRFYDVRTWRCRCLPSPGDDIRADSNSGDLYMIGPIIVGTFDATGWKGTLELRGNTVNFLPMKSIKWVT